MLIGVVLLAEIIGFQLINLRVPNVVYVENKGSLPVSDLKLFYVGGVTTVPILEGFHTEKVSLDNLRAESGLTINYRDADQKLWGDTIPVYLEGSSSSSVYLSVDSKNKVRWLVKY